jgi:hypothetical protein
MQLQMHNRPRHAPIDVHTHLDPRTAGNPSLSPALTMLDAITGRRISTPT